MSLQICRILPDNLDAFRPYLLTQIVGAVEAGDCRGLGVYEGDLALGALAFSLWEEAAELRSLYVDPRARRRGAGTLLVQSLRQLCPQLGARSLSLRYSLPTNAENQALDTFLQTCGFPPAVLSAKRFRVRVKDLAEAPFFRRLHSRTPDDGVVPLCDLSLAQYEALCRMPGPASFLQVETYASELDWEVSHALRRDGGFSGYVLFTYSDGVYRLAAAYSAENDRGVFLRLIGRCHEVLIQSAPAETLEFSAVTGRVAQLAQHLLQGVPVETDGIYTSQCINPL